MSPTTGLRDEEGAFIEAFVQPSKRDRYLILLANPRRRKEILDRLNHGLLLDLRPGVAVELAPGETIEQVVLLALAEGAGRTAYLVSDQKELDGKSLPLEEAIRDTAASDGGTIICLSPRSALYRPEAPGSFWLLVSTRADASSRNK